MVSKEEFREEVRRIAIEIHARPRQIRIRSMKKKIGSCSPGRIVTFNETVVEFDDPLRKEAIIHELLHLRYRNHGKMFRHTLGSYLGKSLSDENISEPSNIGEPLRWPNDSLKEKKV